MCVWGGGGVNAACGRKFCFVKKNTFCVYVVSFFGFMFMSMSSHYFLLKNGRHVFVWTFDFAVFLLPLSRNAQARNKQNREEKQNKTAGRRSVVPRKAARIWFLIEFAAAAALP
jgi:hypothetical protein